MERTDADSAPLGADAGTPRAEADFAARSRAARLVGWSIGLLGLLGAAALALADHGWEVALAAGSGGIVTALAVSAVLELRARDRLRAGWLDRLHQLTEDLAAVAGPEPVETVRAAEDRATEGARAPRAMRAELAAFLRSVTDQCAQALARLELQAAEVQARSDLELLARASPALAASLDVQRVAATLEDLVVPRLADTCSLRVTVPTAGGRARHATAAPASGATDGPGERSLTIPLRVQGEQIGELTIYRHQRAVTASEARSVATLAEPAARALAHALRFTEQVRTSDTLQHSLLPEAVLPVEHLEVATRYLAATEGHAVGGDFYDLVQIPGGGAVLLVGDVQGKGVEAAALTSTARHTLRTAALDGAGPATMLHRLNRALLYGQAERTLATGRPSVRFVTVAVVALAPTATGFRAVVASGGHPPPIVIRPSGVVDHLVADGPLLGVFEDPAYEERTVDLALSDVLLLYTDGVTERREQPELFDEAQLGRLVRNMLTARQADAVAQLILDTVVDLNPREVRDDIALLVARVVGPR
jgi:serine phosphatase RsbU (regulator of sigma subunit)